MFTMVAVAVNTFQPTPKANVVTKVDYNSGTDELQTVSGINIYQNTMNPQL
jgi:hypothetical protein